MFQISIFPIKTQESVDLAMNIEQIIHHYTNIQGILDSDIRVNIYNRFTQDITQQIFTKACLNDDIVIVDVTRVGANNEVNNFDIINEFPKSLEHIWIVSRNYLPINFYGIDNSGYPSYKKGKMSNEEIEEWVKTKCSTIDFNSPRPKEEKGIKGFHIASNKAKETYYKMKNEQTNIFISYRTKYENRSPELIEKGYQFSVKELVDNLNNGVYHNGVGKTAKYLDDGNLVFNSELNTKQRAWQLLSIIDHEYISHCDEFWIYGSDDYLDSWWTLGELIIFSYLMYRNIDNRGKDFPRRLIFYNPMTDELREISPLTLSDENAERICRIITNCAPAVMGIESVTTQRMMRDILYGDKEAREKAMNIYMQKELSSVIPAILLAKGMDEDTIKLLLSDEEIINEFTKLMEEVFDNTKEQILQGQVPDDLRQLTKQMMGVQSDMLGFNIEQIVTDDGIIKKGWSREYLEDECFSENFWEVVIYNDSSEHEMKSSSPTKSLDIEKQITELNPKQILEHISFSHPHHCEIGNISEIRNHKINSTPDGKRIKQMASRFFFMPSGGGIIDLSPTHNNLYEVPIYVAE